MSKTVLITGSSSGIGKAAAFAFANAGWNVAATMRSPEKENDFNAHPSITKFKLDVTSSGSIKTCFDDVVGKYGRLDVVVNNAGYGLDGVFEAMTDELIQKQFNTNVFGLMRVTRQAIHVMRAQNSGTIIQVSSMGGRLAFPLYSIYHATKWAVEGFTESLHYELIPFNIRLKLIEPGIIKTEFYGRSREFMKPSDTNVYDDYLQKFEKAAVEATEKGESPELVAGTIIKAANDISNRMRYPVGSPSPMLTRIRRLIPDTWFFKMIRVTYKI